MSCGYRFRGGSKLTLDQVWTMYQQGKQTIAEISNQTGLSASTIKRALSKIKFDWVQPIPKGEGVVHLDATYFGRNTGVLLAIESGSGQLLYMKHIGHEHISDYVEAVDYIAAGGYVIKGIVVDGLQQLFIALKGYKMQMCQFHMVAIVRRKLTKNPQLKAGRELLDLIYRIKAMEEEDFLAAFAQWKLRWHDFLKEKTIIESTGKAIFTHQRLRSAMTSITHYLPYLFTYKEVEGMPNTNNLIEGTFTDMKKNLRTHPGMSAENRIRMINGYFLAYLKEHNVSVSDR